MVIVEIVVVEMVKDKREGERSTRRGIYRG